jgi:hypothetical protein
MECKHESLASQWYSENCEILICHTSPHGQEMVDEMYYFLSIH